MDNRIIDALVKIRDLHGDAVFYNHSLARNMLNDFASTLRKEVIQVSHFLEMNGYFQLKHAGKTYPIVRARLVKAFCATYAVNESTAVWVVDVFSTLLGYNEIRTGAQFVREQNRVALPAGRFEESGERESALAVPPPLQENPEDRFPTAAFRNTSKPRPETPSRDIPRLPARPPDPLRERPPAARISADFHSAAVTQDGRVECAGLDEDGQCNTFEWRDCVAVSAGTYFTAGLKADGTVVATGKNDYGQCNVRHWKDIVEISAGPRHVIGLRSDGTAVAAGQNKSGECNVHYWRNIVHVSAGYQCSFGIKRDRRALVKGDNRFGDLHVSDLADVADIVMAAHGRALALLADGTVARVGREDSMRRDFSAYRNLRQISAAPDYFAGLFTDGTVRLLAYFWEDSGIECSTDDWRGIVAIAAGRYHILGLTNEGTVKAAMLHPDISHNRGQCNVSHWRL